MIVIWGIRTTYWHFPIALLEKKISSVLSLDWIEWYIRTIQAEKILIRGDK